MWCVLVVSSLLLIWSGGCPEGLWLVCLVVSSLLLVWSGGCREGLCGGWFGCVVFVIGLVMWVS